MSNFIREVKVSIFQQENESGVDFASGGFEIISSGKREDIKIDYDIEKTILGSPNQGTITLTNINHSRRLQVRSKNTKLRLFLNYFGKKETLAFVGDILSSSTVKQGPDIITTINVLDGGRDIGAAIVFKKFNGKNNINDIVSSIIRDNFPNTTIGTININGQTGRKGIHLSGRAYTILNKLARQYGFSWSIQNGSFQGIIDGTNTGKLFTVGNDSGALINLSPILQSPQQAQTGVQIQMMQDPRPNPGDKVQVFSQVNPELNGEYNIHVAKTTGSSHAEQATTLLQCYTGIAEVQKNITRS